MTTSTNDFVSTLNNLVETCKDGEEGFRKAAESAKDLSLRQVFTEYSQQRAKFASELQVEVSRIGGKPETGGSVTAAVHRGWLGLKSAVTGHDDHAILEEAERGEDVAVKAYRDALVMDLPSDIHSLIERQYEGVEKAHRNVRTLRDETGTDGLAGGAAVGRVL